MTARKLLQTIKTNTKFRGGNTPYNDVNPVHSVNVNVSWACKREQEGRVCDGCL